MRISTECGSMNKESNIQIVQTYVFGRAVSVYYKLRNGLTIPELFWRFALSSARFKVVEIVEDVEAKMKTIAGEYTLEEFLDKLNFFWEIISQNPQQSRILLNVEIEGRGAFVAVYPSSGIVEFTANADLKNGTLDLPIALDDLMGKTE